MAGEKERQRQTREKRRNGRRRSKECKLTQNLGISGNRRRGNKREREKRLTRWDIPLGEAGVKGWHRDYERKREEEMEELCMHRNGFRCKCVERKGNCGLQLQIALVSFSLSLTQSRVYPEMPLAQL